MVIVSIIRPFCFFSSIHCFLPSLSTMTNIMTSASARVVSAAQQDARAPKQRTLYQLPSKVISSYAPAPDAEKIASEIRDGVNVVNWFTAHFNTTVSAGKKIDIKIDPSRDIAEIVKIAEVHPEVAHILCFGGWNAPHLEASVTTADGEKIWLTGKEYFDAFESWNADLQHKYPGFRGFDGVDWDYEGASWKSETNTFPREVLDIVGELSVLLKQNNYLVTMAPAQSYLDCTCLVEEVGGDKTSSQRATGGDGIAPAAQQEQEADENHTHAGTIIPECEFSFSLELPPWPKDWHPEFLHHGRNAYAYWLGKYGKTVIEREGADGSRVVTHPVPVFDLISIQLYEGKAHADYAVSVLKMPTRRYLEDLGEQYRKGYYITVPAGTAKGEPVPAEKLLVQIPSQNLLWGFAFGKNSAGDFLVEDFDNALRGLDVRGGMFWNMEIDGTGIETDDKSDPSKFLHIAKAMRHALQIEVEPDEVDAEAIAFSEHNKGANIVT
ncbi:unnamed protein product [Amoebophrya sp. A120]|nr:unnamed protein product [Amoebophrya sp. A120]|eukprot:GSA120T00005642001.1